ncbi:MAG: AMP-binding protein [candidate division NC10 bacterium]|nr:AMP-binding protein [candidate division NC10 bacterium]
MKTLNRPWLTTENTFPKLLLKRAREHPKRVAYREKALGIWRPLTWGELYERVRAFALGLTTLGFQPGDTLAIIGDNRPELFIASLAAQAMGGSSLGLYQDSLPEQLQELLDWSDARFILCEDQEQTDKMRKIREGLPKAERVIVDDPKGMWRYFPDPWLITVEEVERLGRERGREEPGVFEGTIEKGKGGDVAILCLTSGTTDLPKMALLTHRNLMSQGLNLLAIDPVRPSDEFVSYLPFAWIGEQMISLTLHLLVGFTINFPEEPETALRDFREIGPHLTFSSPKFYEGLHAGITSRILDSGRLRRWIYEWSLKLGEQAVELEAEGKRVPVWRRLLRRTLCSWLAYRPVLDKVGLKRMRVAWSGGAALGSDYFRFFRALGLNLKQIYGQTEICGISTVHPPGEVKFWTMGRPILETEVRIMDDGEILSRSASVFQGYDKNPEATTKALRDGWLHSGDYGAIDDDGHVICFDRMADVITLKDGTVVAPQVVENMLKFTPWVLEAWVVGPDRPYLSAILNIDRRTVGKWAEDQGIAYTSYMDLSQKPQVLDLLGQVIREANKRMKREWRIMRFVSLYKEFHPDDDELTRTRKLRRRFLLEKYADLVEALYTDRDRFDVSITVRYEDGSLATMRTLLAIRTIPEE